MRKLNVKQKKMLQELADNNTREQSYNIMYSDWNFFNKLEAIHDYDGMIHDADRYVTDIYTGVRNAR